MRVLVIYHSKDLTALAKASFILSKSQPRFSRWWVGAAGAAYTDEATASVRMTVVGIPMRIVVVGCEED